MRLIHGTTLDIANKIQEEGFRARSYFEPGSLGVDGVYGHAGFAVKRQRGGVPVAIVCEVPDDLVKPSPEAKRRGPLKQRGEWCAPGALPASVVLDVVVFEEMNESFERIGAKWQEVLEVLRAADAAASERRAASDAKHGPARARRAAATQAKLDAFAASPIARKLEASRARSAELDRLLLIARLCG